MAAARHGEQALGKLSDGQPFKPGRRGVRSAECVPLRVPKVSRAGSGRSSMSEIEVNSMFVYLGRFAVRPKPSYAVFPPHFHRPELYWVLPYFGVRWLAMRYVPPFTQNSTALSSRVSNVDVSGRG